MKIMTKRVRGFFQQTESHLLKVITHISPNTIIRLSNMSLIECKIYSQIEKHLKFNADQEYYLTANRIRHVVPLADEN